MKSENCKIFLMNGDRNTATTFYIDILESALQKVFASVEYVDNVDDINKNDVVLVITIYSMLKVIRHRFNQNFIFWFQGVQPEELVFNEPHPSFRLLLRKKYMAFWEWFILHRSKVNIFVSDAMRSHYRTKYHYNGKNCFIMPCYNQNIMKEAFFISGKYERPTFVYAGGILKWQCVDEMLQLYNRVKERYPQATLTILTNGRESAEAIVRKYDSRDVTIKFVPVDQLNEEQAKYKYGLLLRADNTVNNVATPTKFNSYMAVGVIPVISRVVYDYNPIIGKMEYVVTNADEKDIDTAFDMIVALEEKTIAPESVYVEYRKIFDTYYDTQSYLAGLSAVLKECL